MLVVFPDLDPLLHTTHIIYFFTINCLVKNWRAKNLATVYTSIQKRKAPKRSSTTTTNEEEVCMAWVAEMA